MFSNFIILSVLRLQRKIIFILYLFGRFLKTILQSTLCDSRTLNHSVIDEKYEILFGNTDLWLEQNDKGRPCLWTTHSIL